MAGDGDHREALEAEIERRGLGARVRMHGHVSEARKLELLQSAWVNLTASSAEGWCLTGDGGGRLLDPERGDGGRRPARVDRGRRDRAAGPHPEELAEKTRELVRDRELRERLGSSRARAREEFTWERLAERNLALLEGSAARRPGQPQALARARPGRHGPRRGARDGGDGRERDRARLHDRLRPAARHERLRLAGGAAIRVHHPDGPRLGPADRCGARGQPRASPAATRQPAPGSAAGSFICWAPPSSSR